MPMCRQESGPLNGPTTRLSPSRDDWARANCVTPSAANCLGYKVELLCSIGDSDIGTLRRSARTAMFAEPGKDRVGWAPMSSGVFC